MNISTEHSYKENEFACLDTEYYNHYYSSDKFIGRQNDDIFLTFGDSLH